MNNSEMPAMPQTWVPDYGNKPPVVAGGLTKREHFAGLAMAAMLSSPKDWLIMDSDVSVSAVEAADGLLAALEKANG